MNKGDELYSQKRQFISHFVGDKGDLGSIEREDTAPVERNRQLMSTRLGLRPKPCSLARLSIGNGSLSEIRELGAASADKVHFLHELVDAR